jgi:hypothetical protein
MDRLVNKVTMWNPDQKGPKGQQTQRGTLRQRRSEALRNLR